MSRRKQDENTLDAFGDNGSNDAVDFIYGDGELSPPPSSLPTMAKPLDLMSIRPDVAQPRRAIPLGIRGGWDGSADEVEHLLRLWKTRADKEYLMDVQSMLEEDSPTQDTDEGETLFTTGLPDDVSATTKGFYELVQLAADIRRVGLTQPITVARDGTGYIIIAGERRYLAHHLLNMWLGKPDRIAAFVKDRHDVWAQASENNVRNDLNAIGMARQVAILIMAMYEEQTDEVFQPFHELVKPGESDLAYYAQVADGREWRVLEGYGERLVNATGLPSQRRVNQYRNLLRIPDDLWMQADAEDWSERKIRNTFNPPSTPQSGTMVPLSNNESFEQTPQERADEHSNVRSAPPTQYRDDTWDDEPETPPPDGEDVLPAGRYEIAPSLSRQMPDERKPWLDARQLKLLGHLNGIISLYQEELSSHEDNPDLLNELQLASVWLHGRNDKDAPNERDFDRFHATADYHVHNYVPLYQLINDEVIRMFAEVLHRGHEIATGKRT